MEVLLLGTGAADGWPNPFCCCASCESALHAGTIRGSTAALVDDVLLLDCGPEAPRAAVRAGRSLGAVRTILLTHSHPDHLGPAALLWRSWASATGPLEVFGPADAVDACRDWVAPGDPVRLSAVTPGQTVTSNGYTCTALAATHEVPTVLWDVTAPEGRTLLYATDTGPLPEASVLAAVGRGYDLVLLEETFGDRTDHGTGHLDLRTFPLQLARLRAVGALGDASRVVAVHLGHRNPPTPELRRRLGAHGAEVLDDGTVLSVDVDDRPPLVGPPRRTLLLGGARSGKSSTAEQLLASEPDVVYVATAGARDGDTEWTARVRAHRARRPPGWTTLETTDLVPLLSTTGPPLLVDCFALWLTGMLDEVGAWADGAWADGAEAAYESRFEALLAGWDAAQRRVVAVSNEVGSGVVPSTWSGRLFRDQLGRLNAALAARSEQVSLVVAGLPVSLRSE